MQKNVNKIFLIVVIVLVIVILFEVVYKISNNKPKNGSPKVVETNYGNEEVLSE